VNNQWRIILFEILDFCPELIVKGDEKLSSDGFYRIAWAFLRPVG